MTTVAVDEAQRNFLRLIEDVALGEHIVITKGHVPVAEIVPVAHTIHRPQFGSAKGMVRMSDDFDVPVEDFRDYTE